MSLDALAPDQRAVVQLVLQQERSYDDLAGLLGISTEAVRERARAGLERVGGPTGDLSEEELGEIADYLLGQQSVSRREATRALLGSSIAARRWANRVADAIEDVARSPLPGIPALDEDAGTAEEDVPVTADTAALATPAGAASAAAEPGPAPVTEDADESTGTAPVRARPRPDAARPGRAGPAAAKGDRRRSSMIGGALLIGGVAIILVALIVFLFNGNDDEDEPAAGNGATPTATASPTVQAAGQIPLRGVNGVDATGSMTIYVSQDGQIAFTIEAEKVPQSKEGEAYAVWLTGGSGRPKRLGFAPTVGEDGKLGVSGPREGDADTFPRDFSRARRVVVSRETSQDAREPGPIILQGTIPRDQGSGG